MATVHGTVGWRLNNHDVVRWGGFCAQTRGNPVVSSPANDCPELRPSAAEVPVMPHNLVQLMHELGPGFAARAAAYDGEDLFVAENDLALKQRGVLRAGIPKELCWPSRTRRYAAQNYGSPQ